ncbi:hypothetical protein [Clostridium tarantellae]|nr:hypothetical protein [Clostridium tarantellae]
MTIGELKEYLESIPGIELLSDKDFEIIKNNILDDMKDNDPE